VIRIVAAAREQRVDQPSTLVRRAVVEKTLRLGESRNDADQVEIYAMHKYSIRADLRMRSVQSGGGPGCQDESINIVVHRTFHIWGLSRRRQQRQAVLTAADVQLFVVRGKQNGFERLGISGRGPDTRRVRRTFRGLGSRRRRGHSVELRK